MTPTPTHRTHRRRPRDPEAIRSALAAALVALIVAAALWLLAPVVHTTGFWQQHFPWAHPREPLPVFTLFLVAGALATGLWPRTWEAELLARGLRSVAWGTLLFWLVGPVLEAPDAAAIALVPALLGMPLAAFGLAKRAPAAARQRVAGAAALSTLGLGLLFALLYFPVDWLLRLILLPIPLALYTLGAPLVLRDVRAADTRARGRARPESGRPDAATRHHLDLEPGTLSPGGGTLGLVLALASLAFLTLIVAPGVPLSGPVAWIVVALTLPIVARNLLRRRGVALPRALIGPPEARVHSAIVQVLPDEQLDRLDDAIERYIRHGTGRRDLAAALAALLLPALPQATSARIERDLGGAGLGPWGRKRREDALASLLGGHGILEAVRHSRQNKRTQAQHGGAPA